MEHTETYDVIVVGAGSAGITAAIAASRQGLKTLLVEEDAQPGGAVTDHFILSFCGLPEEGIQRELGDHLGEMDPFFLENGRHTFEVHHYLLVVRKMLSQAGVIFRPHTKVEKVHVSGDKVTALRVARRGWDQNGETIFQARVFVDATGHGELSFHAGAPYRFGREARAEFNEFFAPEKEDRAIQQATWMYIAEKNGETDFRPSHAFYQDGRYLVWGGGFECPDPTDPAQLEKMQEEAWLAMETQFENLRKKGFKVVSVAPKMGVRETRRVMGDYILNENDLRNGTFFEDRICRANYNIDPWEPKGQNPLWKDKSKCQVPFYTIPYRSLCVKGFSNLLVAGRCISGSHIAMSSYRVITIVALIGQAAGTAAAMAAASDGDIRKVHLPTLQNNLRDNGLDLDTK